MQSRGKVCKRPAGAFMNTPFTAWRRPHAQGREQEKAEGRPLFPSRRRRDWGCGGQSPRIANSDIIGISLLFYILILKYYNIIGADMKRIFIPIFLVLTISISGCAHRAKSPCACNWEQIQESEVIA